MSWNWLEFSFNIIEHWWDYLISLLSLTVVHYVLPSSPVRELESSREQLKWKWILERKNNEKEIIAVYENFSLISAVFIAILFLYEFLSGFFCQGGALSWVWGWLMYGFLGILCQNSIKLFLFRILQYYRSSRECSARSQLQKCSAVRISIESRTAVRISIESCSAVSILIESHSAVRISIESRTAE